MPVDYIVHITERWGWDRRLGDLRTKEMGPDDIELRFWSGYGLVGTRGIVLRRVNGQWGAWRVAVRECAITLPSSVADTLSPDTKERYEADARRKCADSFQGPVSGAVISGDTLDVVAVTSTGNLASVWKELTTAGVTTLPTSVQRSGMMLDGRTWVVQLRVGREYRVSRIEDWHAPQTRADSAIRRINAVMIQGIGWEDRAR